MQLLLSIPAGRQVKISINTKNSDGQLMTYLLTVLLGFLAFHLQSRQQHL